MSEQNQPTLGPHLETYFKARRLMEQGLETTPELAKLVLRTDPITAICCFFALQIDLDNSIKYMLKFHAERGMPQYMVKCAVSEVVKTWYPTEKPNEAVDVVAPYEAAYIEYKAKGVK